MNERVLSAIEDASEGLLSAIDNNDITTASIREKVKMIASLEGVDDDDMIESIVKKLEERFVISMDIGNLFTSEEHFRWLNDRRGNINWFYWDRYSRYLIKNKIPSKVIRTIDKDTDRILEQIENPIKKGSWSRKGLVVGHVQSGKTANYTGLICKAADAGYKIIIVLAGLSNDLRNQTQERIDDGFIGKDTGKIGNDYDFYQILTGVGKIDRSRTPSSMTTRVRDFDSNFAQNQIGLANTNEPVIIVIKKNVSSFKNLVSWLTSNNDNLEDHPMILIDDEADHASINTNKEDLDPTAINAKIIELLDLFSKNNYVGYTATPFANIFINPVKEQIFPEDFIYSLDTPSNYIGPSQIFSDKGLNIVRILKDYDAHIPLGHKKDWTVNSIPISMKESIISFVLSRAARLLRGQLNKHNSMMINVSVFQDVQNQISHFVRDYLNELRNSIVNNFRSKDPLKNTIIKNINEVWNRDYSKTFKDRSNENSGFFSWEDFLHELKDSVSPIEVIEVNSSDSGESLNYDKLLFPNGRNVIAIGGFGLSRGLTIEGLLISYFLRNSRMYDTLMQMGRWFGYRDGFDDLCRVYMTQESYNWYKHIAIATEELRSDFKKMERSRLTPKDFGLCVRSHPDSLLVTAKNKMQASKKVVDRISLNGRQIETSVIFANKDHVENNKKSLESLARNIDMGLDSKRHVASFLYSNVNYELIVDFIKSFINHPASYLTDPNPVVKYIDTLSKSSITKWDVLLVNNSRDRESAIYENYGSSYIRAVRRTVTSEIKNAISSKKRRFASSKWESAGISDHNIKLAEEGYKGRSTPGKSYRNYRDNPLLMVYLIDARDDDNNPIYDYGIPGWSISFPWSSKLIGDNDNVEYIVNTRYWDELYGNLSLEDEGVYDY